MSKISGRQALALALAAFFVAGLPSNIFAPPLSAIPVLDAPGFWDLLFAARNESGEG
jgi:hypothetical protein